MQDNNPKPIAERTNVESVVKAELTVKEWKVIQLLRQVRFGEMTVYKQSGTIIRIEPKLSIIVKEEMDTNFRLGVE